MARFDTDSENRQIQKVDTSTDYALARQVRQRNLAGQINTLLLQPAVFFRTLPSMDLTRQWLWVGVLVLMLIGYSAVRQAEAGTSVADTMTPPVADFGGDEFFGGSFGAPPPGVQVPGSGGDNIGDTASTWTTFLLAATGVVLVWFGQTILLIEVSLFNGRPPSLGKNFQIAVWASIPLGLMALLQVVYMLTDGTIGDPGISGLLVETDFYADQPEFARALMLSLASIITLPWIWSMILIYYGARNALRGKWWSSLLVVVVWAIVLTVAPVVTGEVDASIEGRREGQDDNAENILEPDFGGDNFDFMPPGDGTFSPEGRGINGEDMERERPQEPPDTGDRNRDESGPSEPGAEAEATDEVELTVEPESTAEATESPE